MQEEKTAVRPGRARRLKRLRRWLIFVALFYLMPLAAAGWAYWLRGPRVHWSQADRSPVGLAPDSARTPEAVVQVYAARTYGWRAVFALHTWIALKPARAENWEGVHARTPGKVHGQIHGRPPDSIPDLPGSRRTAGLTWRRFSRSGRRRGRSRPSSL